MQYFSNAALVSVTKKRTGIKLQMCVYGNCAHFSRLFFIVPASCIRAMSKCCKTRPNDAKLCCTVLQF